MERPDAWHMTERLKHELGKGDPFAAAIRATRMPMIITDPRQDDNPIVFANDAFLTLTGYGRGEIMGRNCRFLQGPETDPESIDRVRQAVRDGTDVNVDLFNYRKDGTAFWNALYISPVITEAGELQYFFASQLDVTERKDALTVKTMLLHEVDHRVKNNLQIISALIAMQARTIADPAIRTSLETMLQRVEALSIVHRRLYQSDDVTRFDVAEFVRDIVTDLVGATGRTDLEARLDLEHVHVLAERAAPLALIVNELVTNALKHAFVDGRRGSIAVSVRRNDDQLRISIQDDGVGMSDGASGSSSFGQSIVRALGRQLGATIEWAGGQPSGTRVEITTPLA